MFQEAFVAPGYNNPFASGAFIYEVDSYFNQNGLECPGCALIGDGFPGPYATQTYGEPYF